MARGFARRAFYLALILLGVSILCFALLRLSGRDPALAVALRAQSASEAVSYTHLHCISGADVLH